LPKDNNMSAFYKNKDGLLYKPKKIAGYTFPNSKQVDNSEDPYKKLNPGPGNYPCEGQDKYTT